MLVGRSLSMEKEVTSARDLEHIQINEATFETGGEKSSGERALIAGVLVLPNSHLLSIVFPNPLLRVSLTWL
jgi:hypothetical protein